MVRKDSGDDPDVTNGTLIGAAVSFGENVQRAEESGEELPGIYSDHSQSFRISDRRNRGWTGDKEGAEMPGWLSGH